MSPSQSSTPQPISVETRYRPLRPPPPRSAQIPPTHTQLYRAIQYLARFLAWLFLARGNVPEAARWNALKSHLALARKRECPPHPSPSSHRPQSCVSGSPSNTSRPPSALPSLHPISANSWRLSDASSHILATSPTMPSPGLASFLLLLDLSTCTPHSAGQRS